MFTTATPLAGTIMKGQDETNPVSPGEQPAPLPGSHGFPFAHHLEMEGETRNGFPRASLALLHFFLDLSLPSVHRGPREEEEEGGGNKLWLVLL